MTILCPVFIHHLWLPHQFAHFKNQNLIKTSFSFLCQSWWVNAMAENQAMFFLLQKWFMLGMREEWWTVAKLSLRGFLHCLLRTYSSEYPKLRLLRDIKSIKSPEGISLALPSPFSCIHPFVALHTCYYSSGLGCFYPELATLREINPLKQSQSIWEKTAAVKASK